MQTLHNEWILILDFGSQYTQLIARRLRELNVYCEIHPYNTPPASIGDNFPKGIILSGGPRSVYDDDAPALNLDYLEMGDRKSTRLNSSHVAISYAVFCLKKKT